MVHFPCDKSNTNQNKTVQFNIQLETLYSPQIEVHKAIINHITNNLAFLTGVMDHYYKIEKRDGKEELGRLIHNALKDFMNNKSDGGQKRPPWRS